MKNQLCFFIVFFLFSGQLLNAQNSFICIVKDAETNLPIPGVSVILVRSKNGASTDTSGKVILNNIPIGSHGISFSSIGYTSRTIQYVFPLPDSITIVLLERPAEATEEEVVVSSSRTESGIENLPTKVEVLGAEEVNEEVGIKPGNIASLLGDVAGIQIQQTSAATGNAEMRVQGLPGEYTQLLKDGMPLFGGYSGSFSILQVPPLDLKQIEIVKGPSSTLYGGGAIAGMVNLVSKRPKKGVFEKTFLLNQSSLGESNVNVYLSNRKNKIGYTIFTGFNYQKAVDVNKDGFSDLPHTKSFFIHPTLFVYPNEKNEIYIGYNAVFDKRNGGDMQVIKGEPNNDHQYFIDNHSYRHTVDASWENKINARDRFIIKGTASWFTRKFDTNVFGMNATQLSYYTEASWLKKSNSNDLVIGMNVTGEQFRKKQPDSSQLVNYTYSTIGLFIQDDWRVSSKFVIQPGLRTDFHNQYGAFVLPRLSLLYRVSSYFTSRLGGGLGYRIPTVFNNDIDERDYGHIVPLQDDIKAERSVGANWDINYHQKINGWDLTANQAVFYAQINRPLVMSTLGSGDISFYNADDAITTKGLETYVQVLHDELEIYLGYIYTAAKKLYDKNNDNLSLIAKNKFATIIAYEFSSDFRAGIECAYTGKQYLDDGSQTPGYLFMAAMMRYDLHKFSFVLNCENLLDYRQTRKESIVIPPYSNPDFKQLWAPIDGRVVNLSVRLKL